MKKSILYLTSVLAAFQLVAQEDYALFPTDSVIHKSELLNFPTVLKDSYSSNGFTYQEFYSNYSKDFHDPVDNYMGMMDYTPGNPNCTVWRYAHWLGDHLKYNADGDYTFVNRDNEEFLIKSKANTGDSWIVYNYTDGRSVQANVISIVYDQFPEFNDSVKVIQLYGLNDANFPDPNNPVNDIQIRISKEHGLIDAPALFDFPHKMEPMTYLEKHNPDKALELSNRYKAWDMNVGDVFHTWYEDFHDYGIDLKHRKDEITILSKEWSAAGEYFVYEKQIKREDTQLNFLDENEGGPATKEVVSISAFTETDSIFLNDYSYMDNVLYGFPQTDIPGHTDYMAMETGSSNMGTAKNAFNADLFKIGMQMHHFRYDSIPDDTFWCEVQYITPQIIPNYYVEGCGGPFYKAIRPLPYYASDTRIQKRLVYIKKGSYEWGTPFNLNIEEIDNQTFVLYPNPAKENVYIQSNLQQIQDFVLIDALGRRVMSFTVSPGLQIKSQDISGLKKGIYFLQQFVDGKKSHEEKLVVQ